jgi:single-stranded DNA-binding protein
MNNSFRCTGRFTKDPVLRKGEKPEQDRLWFVLAINREFAKPDADIKADYPSFTVWGATARAASKHCSQGKEVTVEGELRTYRVEKDGQVDYRTEVLVRPGGIKYGPDAKKGKEVGQSAEALMNMLIDKATEEGGAEELVNQLKAAAAKKAEDKQAEEPPAHTDGDSPIPG